MAGANQSYRLARVKPVCTVTRKSDLKHFYFAFISASGIAAASFAEDTAESPAAFSRMPDQQNV